MEVPTDGNYTYIRGYCKMMSSLPYFVAEELRLARNRIAPADAYASKHDSNGKLIGWRCLSDIEDATYRQRIEEAAY